MKNKLFGLIVVLMCLGLFTNSFAGISDKAPVDGFPTKYDSHFRMYTKRNFGPVEDYRWFKSQTMAESAFNPNAKSWVGAGGLMQLMPGTMTEVVGRSGYIENDRFNARWNVAAGIYYDSTLYRQWKSKRPELDRKALMFASYNAGIGNILKAQGKCTATGLDINCGLWSNIKAQGPNVRSWRYDETIGYVNRIMKFMGYKNW